MNRSSTSYTKNYFFALSIILFLLGIIAFLDNLVLNVDQESNSDPVFIIHGLLMYTWLGILILQTNHIRKLNRRAHMRFGIAGFGVAFFMMSSIVYIYLTGPAFHEVPFFAKANRIFFPVFVILIALAYVKRNKPELHKHLIFVGMLIMLEPILSRVSGNLGLNPMILVPAIWILLWASLWFYDLKSKGKIHPLTYFGLFFWIAIYALLFF